MRGAIPPPPNTSSCRDALLTTETTLLCRDSSVGIALGCGLDDRSSRVRFPAGLGIFLFTTASRTALVPIEPPIQWVPEALSLGVKRSAREADHSPPSNAEVQECVALYLLPQYVFMAWCLVKHRDNFTFISACTGNYGVRTRYGFLLRSSTEWQVGRLCYWYADKTIASSLRDIPAALEVLSSGIVKASVPLIRIPSLRTTTLFNPSR
jgi:hypothetical protein